jgi:hypothetical protein
MKLGNNACAGSQCVLFGTRCDYSPIWSRAVQAMDSSCVHSMRIRFRPGAMLIANKWKARQMRFTSSGMSSLRSTALCHQWAGT